MNHLAHPLASFFNWTNNIAGNSSTLTLTNNDFYWHHRGGKGWNSGNLYNFN